MAYLVDSVTGTTGEVGLELPPQVAAERAFGNKNPSADLASSVEATAGAAGNANPQTSGSSGANSSERPSSGFTFPGSFLPSSWSRGFRDEASSRPRLKEEGAKQRRREEEEREETLNSQEMGEPWDYQRELEAEEAAMAGVPPPSTAPSTTSAVPASAEAAAPPGGAAEAAGPNEGGERSPRGPKSRTGRRIKFLPQHQSAVEDLTAVMKEAARNLTAAVSRKLQEGSGATAVGKLLSGLGGERQWWLAMLATQAVLLGLHRAAMKFAATVEGEANASTVLSSLPVQPSSSLPHTTEAEDEDEGVPTPASSVQHVGRRRDGSRGDDVSLSFQFSLSRVCEPLECAILESLCAKDPALEPWFWGEPFPVLLQSLVAVLQMHHHLALSVLSPTDPTTAAQTAAELEAGHRRTPLSEADSVLYGVWFEVIGTSKAFAQPSAVACPGFSALLEDQLQHLLRHLSRTADMEEVYRCTLKAGLRDEFLHSFAARAGGHVSECVDRAERRFWVQMVERELSNALMREGLQQLCFAATTSTAAAASGMAAGADSSGAVRGKGRRKAEEQVALADLTIFSFFLVLGRATRLFLVREGASADTDKGLATVLRHLEGAVLFAFPEFAHLANYHTLTEVAWEDLSWLPLYPPEHPAPLPHSSTSSAPFTTSTTAANGTSGGPPHGPSVDGSVRRSASAAQLELTEVQQKRSERRRRRRAVRLGKAVCGMWLWDFARHSVWVADRPDSPAAEFLRVGQSLLEQCVDTPAARAKLETGSVAPLAGLSDSDGDDSDDEDEYAAATPPRWAGSDVELQELEQQAAAAAAAAAEAAAAAGSSWGGYGSSAGASALDERQRRKRLEKDLRNLKALQQSRQNLEKELSVVISSVDRLLRLVEVEVSSRRAEYVAARVSQSPLPIALCEGLSAAVGPTATSEPTAAATAAAATEEAEAGAAAAAEGANGDNSRGGSDLRLPHSHAEGGCVVEEVEGSVDDVMLVSVEASAESGRVPSSSSSSSEGRRKVAVETRAEEGIGACTREDSSGGAREGLANRQDVEREGMRLAISSSSDMHPPSQPQRLSRLSPISPPLIVPVPPPPIPAPLPHPLSPPVIAPAAVPPPSMFFPFSSSSTPQLPSVHLSSGWQDRAVVVAAAKGSGKSSDSRGRVAGAAGGSRRAVEGEMRALREEVERLLLVRRIAKEVEASLRLKVDVQEERIRQQQEELSREHRQRQTQAMEQELQVEVDSRSNGFLAALGSALGLGQPNPPSFTPSAHLSAFDKYGHDALRPSAAAAAASAASAPAGSAAPTSAVRAAGQGPFSPPLQSVEMAADDVAGSPLVTRIPGLDDSDEDDDDDENNDGLFGGGSTKPDQLPQRQQLEQQQKVGGRRRRSHSMQQVQPSREGRSSRIALAAEEAAVAKMQSQLQQLQTRLSSLLADEKGSAGGSSSRGGSSGAIGTGAASVSALGASSRKDKVAVFPPVAGGNDGDGDEDGWTEFFGHPASASPRASAATAAAATSAAASSAALGAAIKGNSDAGTARPPLHLCSHESGAAASSAVREGRGNMEGAGESGSGSCSVEEWDGGSSEVTAGEEDGADDEELEKVRKNIMDHLREEGADAWRGTQLLSQDVATALKLLQQAATGKRLTGREGKVLQRTLTDLATVIPIGLFMAIPVTPVGHAAGLAAIKHYAPHLFPSSYNEHRLDIARRLEEVRSMGPPPGAAGSATAPSGTASAGASSNASRSGSAASASAMRKATIHRSATGATLGPSATGTAAASASPASAEGSRDVVPTKTKSVPSFAM